MAVALILLIVGVLVLSRAADQFVVGAARLAAILDLSPVVIGAVVVGFGTSAPEMLVSALAAAQGEPDIGIGNVVGSNTANLSLILGAAAIIVPLRIDSTVLRREGRLATGAAIGFAIVAYDGLSLVDGVVLAVALVGALMLMLRRPPGDNTAIDEEVGELIEGEHRLAPETVRTLIGLGGTVLGAWLLLTGATSIAEDLGLAGGFVGLSLVAVGTSLPELVTAVAAARQKHDELIVGNLLGSNLFNSLGVGALVGVLGDGSLQSPGLTHFSIALMVAICIGAFIAMRTAGVVTRAEGIALIAVFVGFLTATYLAGGTA